MANKHVLGVDIGGTGIKAAVVDVETGALITERLKVLTPKPSYPEAVATTLNELLQQFNSTEPYIGVGFPAVIENGKSKTAANIEKSWIGTDVEKLLHKHTGYESIALNDADAAGIAEMNFGAGRGVMGTVMLVTVGTGLGTALFHDGHLVPNTEMGHIMIDNADAELYASNTARKNLELSWEEWGFRFNRYLTRLHDLLHPELFIIGGGASKRWERFDQNLTVDAKVIPAQMLNASGCIGAAVYAHQKKNGLLK